jgi:hypothetical protein
MMQQERLVSQRKLAVTRISFIVQVFLPRFYYCYGDRFESADFVTPYIFLVLVY